MARGDRCRTQTLSGGRQRDCCRSPSRSASIPHRRVNPSLTFAETVDCLVHAELTGSSATGSQCDGSRGAESSGDNPLDSGARPFAAFDLHRARLYVLPVADDTSVGAGAGTMPNDGIVLLDSDENPYRLLRRTRHHSPIIAGCLVATGWCAPFGLDDDANATPPSSHPLRQRVRLTVAVTDYGIASVLRHSDDPHMVHTLPTRGIGDLPDILEIWWRG